MFVPPHVLENLAKVGITPARTGVNQSRLSREKRDARTKTVGVEVLAAAASPGQGLRKVYDSQHTSGQRVRLVRDEGGAATADGAVNKIYDYAGMVRGYFKDVLTRNSIDNLGMDVILNAHFGTNYMNAFWDGDGCIP